jgi:tetratricopeptide (TPR) repeat protein
LGGKVNVKSEIRNPKTEGWPKSENPSRAGQCLLFDFFGFRTSDFLRILDFGLRISLARPAALLLVLLLCPAPALAADSAALDTCRQLGKAGYENDDFKSAAGHFRRAIELAPDSATDCFNLGLVLMRAADYTNALAALDKAEQLDPKLLGAHYIRGIVFKRQGEFPKAIESLKRVVAGDPQCVGAYYNLAMCYKSAEQYTNAIATLTAALEREPNNPSCHYQLITLYRRVGNVEDAARHSEVFDRLKDTVDESEKTAEALERSKYSYVIEVPPAGSYPEAAGATQVRFVEVTKEAGLTPPAKPPPLPPRPPSRLKRADYTPELARNYVVWNGGSVALGDYDGDGRTDIYIVNCSTNEEASANCLYHNEGGWRFTDVTARAGVGDRHLGTHAVWGDYDNDKYLDLYVVNDGPNVLYHNRGDGTFEDVSGKARVNEPQFGSRAAFVDYDHDNDLDIFVANNVELADPPRRDPFALPDDLPGQVSAVFRNNGNGTFTDQTDEAGLLVAASQTRDFVCADFDGDNTTDLFVANFDSSGVLFLNARMGKFTVGGLFSPPLSKGARAVAEADFNHDGHPGLVVATETNLLLYANDGRAHFTGSSIPLPATLTAKGVARIRVFDFNNDGWPDLLLADAEGAGLYLFAGAGKGRFREVTAATGLDKVTGVIADFATADLDGDGDVDIVGQTRDRGPIVLRNDGGNQRHWLEVRLRGKKVNRGGYGATVEVATGGYYQKQTVREEVIPFGLGNLTNVPVVRVTWPNGMAQNVIQPAIDRTLEIEEYVRVSASCAFLWADGGKGFKLVNEILGVGPLGVPMTKDQYFPLNCAELTKIEADQLVARDEFYELRLTEDLRELAFVDQVNLRVVDHPAELEMIPNEMFTGPPFPEDKFFAVPDHRVPRSAVDDRGNDVLEFIRHRDGRYPALPLTDYDGLARPHSLTLDLGDLSEAGQIMLYLDSWIYWADSSVSWGIFQNPDCEITPLKLEVRDEKGNWHTAIESVGLPTSKGIVVPVDLTGKFLCPDWHVRLSTTMCVYFDRIFVSTRDEAARCRMTTLPVILADLHYRGFSKMTRDELGFERFDYDECSSTGSWNPPRGQLTRYGDVTPLLASPDDMYVIIAPGDELTMRFDAAQLPALPAGWKRSFNFYANGWVKDGDLNTRFSETVEPLPFHGMSGYPYPANEHYPDDSAHRDYLRTYHTRPSQPRTGDLTQFQK